MTVKEVVMLAAAELDITTDVAGYFDGTEDAGKVKAERLLACFNLVENELALDYFPLSRTEILVSTGTILFSQFKNAPVNIISVKNSDGVDLEYTLSPDRIMTGKGTIRVTYTFTPNTKTIDDVCDFSLEVSARLMSYGISAEYSLATGALEEAALWDKKYKDAIALLYKREKGGRITSRRWV